MHTTGRVRNVLLGFLAVILIFSVLHSRANAAEAGFNLTTSPLPVLLTTKPGGSVNTDLRVQNSGTSPVRLHVSLMKFKAEGTTGRPLLANRAPGDDYFDWVHFSTTSFEAQPGAWNSIGMNITVPKDGAFGYYYAVVFSKEAGETTKPTSNASQLQGATAVLVLLDVQTNGEKRQLEIKSFAANKRLFEYLPANFTVKVRNIGNIHGAPSGNIFINRGKKTIATLDVNPGNGNILPNSERDFNASWSDGFPVFQLKQDHGQVVSDKKGLPVYQLSWNFSKVNHLRFGHYTAHLLLTYDNGTRDVPMEAEVSFWVLPWKILPLIILLIVLIGVGIWASSRGAAQRIRKKWAKKE